MSTLVKFLFIAFSLTIVSCKQNEKKKVTINPEWKKLSLPNGWTFYAPNNFTTKSLQGIDSKPGVINSNQDSIYLQYDSGSEMIKNKNCSFQKSAEKAKEDIEKGFYKEFYKIPSKHTAYLDTVDNMIAIIVKPTITGEGTVGISISDCKTGKWLGITGTNLELEKEKLVLEIFKTIKLTLAN